MRIWVRIPSSGSPAPVEIIFLTTIIPPVKELRVRVVWGGAVQPEGAAGPRPDTRGPRHQAPGLPLLPQHIPPSQHAQKGNRPHISPPHKCLCKAYYLLRYTCGLTSGGPGRASEEVSGSGCGSRLWLDPKSGSV
jgi:hypothetical protein